MMVSMRLNVSPFRAWTGILCTIVVTSPPSLFFFLKTQKHNQSHYNYQRIEKKEGKKQTNKQKRLINQQNILGTIFNNKYKRTVFLWNVWSRNNFKHA